MTEERSINAGGQSSKKTASGQKFPAKKPQKEQPKSATQTMSGGNIEPAILLVNKIDDIGSEIEGKPLKSFEKKDQTKLLQSYEKLITKMIREINNSRR